MYHIWRNSVSINYEYMSFIICKWSCDTGRNVIHKFCVRLWAKCSCCDNNIYVVSLYFCSTFFLCVILLVYAFVWAGRPKNCMQMKIIYIHLTERICILLTYIYLINVNLTDWIELNLNYNRYKKNINIFINLYIRK